jgi:hypothetical protein
MTVPGVAPASRRLSHRRRPGPQQRRGTARATSGMVGRCYIPNGWTGVGFFYVQERFLAFTHWAAIPLPMPLILHEPERPGTHGAVCPGR